MCDDDEESHPKFRRPFPGVFVFVLGIKHKIVVKNEMPSIAMMQGIIIINRHQNENQSIVYEVYMNANTGH